MAKLMKKLRIPMTVLMVIAHILIVKNRDKVTFSMPEQPQLYIYGILGIAVAFCFLFYFILITVIQKLLEKDKKFLAYFKYFAGYFAFMSVFWLLTWPGIFKGDEFYVIRGALNFTLSGGQSGLTSILYIVALLFFPSMATITFVQLLIICTLFSVIMHDMEELITGKQRLLLYIPFLLLPVIDGNLFTLRATLVSWLFLFVMCKLYYLAKKDCISLQNALLLSAICGLLTAWRSEYIYLLVLLPATLLILKKINFKQAILVFFVFILSYSLFQVPNKIALNGSNKYPISLVLNPVANLFTEVETLKGPAVYDDVMEINTLVDAALLRQSASVRNISQYWNIPDILPEEKLSSFMKSALRLIIYNPDKFMKYRWQTFAYTNGLYPDRVNHPCGTVDSINKLVYYDMDYKTMFVFMNPPFGQELREKTISVLACRTYGQDEIKTNALLPVFYNCIPVILCMLVLFVLACCKKDKLTAMLVLMISAQVALIFLTAPAMFFMYYFCFYLSGYFLTALAIADKQK
ncbi:MAG: hypothetical protein E7289_03050 [Lachnospiraceae bacterium]|nr:hypothetical protein [Lachnospiraceae bacterium]